VNDSVAWQLMLLPRLEGRLVIPALTVDTDSGVLRTAPVTLQVDHGVTPTASQVSANGSMISVTASASTTTPYQNQSLDYTVRCVVRGHVTDVSLGDVVVSNAIVEPPAKPTVHDQVENGGVVRVVEFHYIITPLQPGNITIPPVTLKGEIEAPDIAAMSDPFGGQFSSAMRQAMNFLSSFGGQPFSVASNSTQLQVRPPAAAMDPWLPLRSLKIIEDIDASQVVRVGEPLIRKLTLLADGAVGSQLPDMEAQQGHADFKIYADKPATGEDIDAKTGGILGWRKESYNLVALKPGTLILPAIRVRWWDIVNNKAATAELPERMVNVLPGAIAQNPPPLAAKIRAVEPSQPPGRTPATVHVDVAILYVLGGLLAGCALFAIFWGLKARRQVNRPVVSERRPTAVKTVSRPIRDARLETVRTVAELKSFLQRYAHENWGASKNAPLEAAFSAVPGWEQDSDDIRTVVREIEGTLYAGKPANMDDLKKRCLRIIAASRKEAGVRQKRPEKLKGLNPS
jgi:hypothetical protein